MCDYEDERILGRELCPSCAGAGTYDIGDCELGVTENCPECEGYGYVE